MFIIFLLLNPPPTAYSDGGKLNYVFSNKSIEVWAHITVPPNGILIKVPVIEGYLPSVFIYPNSRFLYYDCKEPNFKYEPGIIKNYGISTEECPKSKKSEKSDPKPFIEID